MKYDVVIIVEAEEELEEAYRFIREDSPDDNRIDGNFRLGSDASVRS